MRSPESIPPACRVTFWAADTWSSTVSAPEVTTVTSPALLAAVRVRLDVLLVTPRLPVAVASRLAVAVCRARLEAAVASIALPLTVACEPSIAPPAASVTRPDAVTSWAMVSAPPVVRLMAPLSALTPVMLASMSAMDRSSASLTVRFPDAA